MNAALAQSRSPNLSRPRPQITPQQAAAELLGRRRARVDILTYASSIEIPGAPIRSDDESCENFRPVEAAFGRHQLLWLECLQRIENGEIRRLMGLMPPGSAKSTYTSVVFPTHYMGRFPGSLVITTNYGSDLPRKWGRKARSIIRQRQYRRVFDTGLAADSQAADEWSLDNGSEFMGAGILAGITGNRADGVVWDDLIKGRKSADSKVVRDKTWEAYFDDLLTRKKPNAWEVGITTRWHEDDIAGRILPANYNDESGFIDCRDGNRWYVLCLPAECDRADDPLGRKIGERIWPEWFPEDHFRPFRLNARTWSALYQQRPSPEEGDYFSADWLRPYDQPPALSTLAIYGASDYAVTADGGDYTVHVVVGVDAAERMYLLDLWRGRTATDVWVETWCDLVKKWHPIGWAEESGQIKSGIGPFRATRARERQAWCALKDFPTRGDKAVRAQSIRGRMGQLGLYVPISAPWYPDLRSELLAFPAGAHDDQVDALGLIGQILNVMRKGSAPAAEAQPVRGATEMTLDETWLLAKPKFAEGRII